MLAMDAPAPVAHHGAALGHRDNGTEGRHAILQGHAGLPGGSLRRYTAIADPVADPASVEDGLAMIEIGGAG